MMSSVSHLWRTLGCLSMCQLIATRQWQSALVLEPDCLGPVCSIAAIERFLHGGWHP
jgi:hypothetical protein